MPHLPAPSEQRVSADGFRRRFYVLILAAWVLPPVLGLSFLMAIGMFSRAQMERIMTTPLEPVFVIGTLVFAVVYFGRFARPLVAYLENPSLGDQQAVLRRMQRFPLNFWVVFLVYLLLAPSSVIVSAEHYAGFVPQPIDWFRIHLVALIVSILVGLPIFFAILDLFGQAAGTLRMQRPLVTLKVKVFMIGALVPLLVDSMIVQYYWTRTGYFGFETFMVWLVLEVLAVLGSLLFVRSFEQSLQPLQGFIDGAQPLADQNLAELQPNSTDELGVLTVGYRKLLQEVQVRNELLAISNRALRSGDEATGGEVMTAIVELCQKTAGGDLIFLIVHDAKTNEMVAVVQTNRPYNPDGYFRLPIDDTSMAGWVFQRGSTIAINDIPHDPRACAMLRDHLNAYAAMAAPLCAEGGVVGVLLLVHLTSCEYAPEDVSMLEVFAREVALAVHTQILQRQRAEADAARRAGEEQVRLLLNSTAEAIFGVDLDGNCIFVNPTCLRLLGYAHEKDLLGKNMHALIHHSYPDGRAYPIEQCRVRKATMRGETGHSDEEMHWRADGTGIPVEYWSHPIYKDGELIGSVVTFVDITERKQAERELHRLSQSNRLLLESTGDGIFGVDTELHCTFVNRAAASMLGFDPEELRGRDMHTLVHHSREDGTIMPVEESLIYRTIHEDRSFWSDSEVLWHKGVSSFPVQYSANPIREKGSVTGAVVVFRNVTEARAMARKMDYLATHDALTGLFNRREFEQRLEQALLSARSESRQHVLCYMDLDQFKVVNDTCGHVAGDEMLRQLTTLLHPMVRQSDTLARLGGDEFGVLLQNCTLSHAVNLVNDLRNIVQDFRFVWEDKTFSVGVSTGVVAISAETDSIASAMSAADAACYMAKDSGRNRVHVYEADDAELVRRRGEMQWVSRIHDALDHGRFLLTYQTIEPISGPATGLHLEVLIRMREDGGGTIPPGAFLPAAERYNVMPAIDRWVVRTTFQWLRDHKDRLDDLALCTINLSGHSLGDASFLQFVIDQLTDTGVPATCICFEVTETAAVANLSQAVRFMRKLREYGCQFALDDFGSGMSSFAYLKNLPVDFLKIDGNFVRDLVRDPIDRAMVEAINQVGHVMGIRTIAEFVEDTDILEQLRHIGVDFAQGYGIAAPQPLDMLFADASATCAVAIAGNAWNMGE